MKTIIYNLFKISLLILFLYSIFAWFLWDSRRFVFPLSFGITVIYLMSSKGILRLKKSHVIPIILLLIVELYINRGFNKNNLILTLLTVTIISIVILLNDRIKNDLLQFFTKAIACLLLISLLAWILFLFGLPLPYYSTGFSDNNSYFFHNYYFFLFDTFPSNVFFPRFSSVFLEPGHLGVMTSLLICANKFEIKNKSVLIMYIAIIFSFSLASYITLTIAGSAYLILDSKNPIRNAVLCVSFLSLFYIFFSTLNDGENVINRLIFDRLKIEDDDIAGNNRFSKHVDYLFQTIMDTNDRFFGMSYQDYTNEKGLWGAGYKIFILQHGIIGALLVFLFYLYVVLGNNSKMAWILFIVYILVFLDLGYPLLEFELLIFITAMPTLRDKSRVVPKSDRACVFTKHGVVKMQALRNRGLLGRDAQQSFRKKNNEIG